MLMYAYMFLFLISLFSLVEKLVDNRWADLEGRGYGQEHQAKGVRKVNL